MIELIKKYKGECITDLNGGYTFSDLVNQINEFKNLLSNKIRNHDRVLIYSDYTFHSISLLISLSDLNVNIIPLVKTTESEYQEKVESVNPHLILSFNDNNKLIIKNSKLTPNKEDVFNDVSNKGDEFIQHYLEEYILGISALASLKGIIEVYGQILIFRYHK